MIKKYNDIEELKKEIINIINLDQVEEDIYECNEEINEIIQNVYAINLKINYFVTQQIMMDLDRIRRDILNVIDSNDNILNEVMKKILGEKWYKIKNLNSFSNSNSFVFDDSLNDDKKIFDFMCSLQKIRCIRYIYIKIECFIKDINCNYSEGKELMRMSQSDEERAAYLSREMALRDEATRLEEAREEGIEQTKIENARNLFDVLDDETISKRIKLDLDRAKKLREEWEREQSDN